MLPALFSLGWLPPGQYEDGAYIRASTLKLLASFRLGESMELLSATLQDGGLPKTATNAIRYLLARRILQPNGISSLLSMTISSEDHGSDLLDRYEQITKLLSTPPRGIATDEYFRAIIPQMVRILTDKASPPAHQRAISFALSSFVSTETQPMAFTILSSILFAAFEERDLSHESETNESYSPMKSIGILSTFMATAPPSSNKPLATVLLTPIIERLYSLLYYLDTRAISDPTETALCKGLVHSWMKVTADQGVCDRLWSLVQRNGGEWVLSGTDELRLEWRKEIRQPTLTLGDLSNLEVDAMNLNPLNLRPDPVHLITLVQSVNRKDVASSFFIRILSAEFESLDGPDDPTQKLLRMQLMYQLQKRLPSSILSNPGHALAFVDHVLTTTTSTTTKRKPPSSLVNPVESLRFIRDDKDMEEQEDQVADILRTAVDFLLSSLEANPKYVPIADDPHVTRIKESLKRLELHSSLALRQAAREASLVLIARQSGASVALSSSSSQGIDEKKKSSREVYQEALVLLQDPLLPVRAQGLAMLRHLVEGSSSSSSAEVIDSALVPAILDIFVNSVQNEDSFLFLNAVQGLVATAQRFGRDVFKRLIEIYSTPERVGATSSIGGGMSKQELDVKLRVGEALGEIVGRCGQALGGYVDLLLPSIFATIRNKDVPTTLRTSSISIASRAVETAPLIMSRFTGELSSAMLDILELEHAVAVEPIRRQPPPPNPPPRRPSSGETETEATMRKPEPESMATTRKSDKSDSVSGRGGSGGGGEGAPMSTSTSKESKGVLAGIPEPSLEGSTTKIVNGEEATVQERKGADNGRSYEGTGSSGGGRGGGQPGERDDSVTDADPTRANAKLSPLRRSAIHFLRTVVRSLLAGDDGDWLFHHHNSATTIVGGGGGGVLSTGMEFPVRRAATVLRYLSSLDVDGTVRLMALETVELISEAARIRMVGRGA
ncbi:hypothetical protein FRC18_012206 [Serendipita sp. 400]|nr:hypothetical protein FRC18_012206 [Serendipita sp. 400]